MEYLIKINGITIPNNFIVENSYNPWEKPIVISDYYDTEYNRHIIFAPKNECVIEFTLRKLYESEYRKIAELFSGDMTVEYYDFKTGRYKNGIFTCKDTVNPSSYVFRNEEAVVNQRKIKLYRKRAIE